MSINVSEMSRAERAALMAEIAKADEAAKAQELADAKAAIKAIDDELKASIKKLEEDAKTQKAEKAKELGFTLAELTGKAKTASGRAPAKPQYQNPADTSVTWTGKGKRPKWFVAHMEQNGLTLKEAQEQCRIPE